MFKKSLHKADVGNSVTDALRKVGEKAVEEARKTALPQERVYYTISKESNDTYVLLLISGLNYASRSFKIK